MFIGINEYQILFNSFAAIKIFFLIFHFKIFFVNELSPMGVEFDTILFVVNLFLILFFLIKN